MSFIDGQNNPQSFTPAGYPAVTPKKNNSKTVVVIVVIAAFLLLFITALVIVIAGKQNDSDSDHVLGGIDADQSDYDISDQNTGGEEVELSENETLDFLKGYNISEEDILSIENEVYRRLDEYYADQSFNTIIYDVQGVSVSNSGKFISFSFQTDVGDMVFHVSLELNNGNTVTKITVI